MENQAVHKNLKNVLTQLFEMPLLKSFYLAGGTNIALKYNHRISTDIDLFLEPIKHIDFEYELVPKLVEYYKDDCKVVVFTKNTLRTQINHIKVDFLQWSSIKKMLKPTEVFPNSNWILAHDFDVAAMKMNAIINRGTRKDYFDVLFLAEKYGLKTLIEAYKKKYNVVSDVELVKYLIDFSEADLESEHVLQVPDNKIINWVNIKNELKILTSNYIKKKH